MPLNIYFKGYQIININSCRDHKPAIISESVKAQCCKIYRPGPLSTGGFEFSRQKHQRGRGKNHMKGAILALSIPIVET